MNTQDLMEEQEIDLIDLIWRLLEQWRGMLALGLIFAMLVPGVKYIKDSREYSASQAGMSSGAVISDSDTSVLVLEQFDDDVNAAIVAYGRMQQSLDYSENSVLMQYDPEDYYICSLTYEITSDGTFSDTNLLLTRYLAFPESKLFYDALGEVLEVKDSAYLKELIAVKKGENLAVWDPEQSVPVTFTILITLPDEVKSSDVEKAVTAALDTYGNSIKASACVHSVELIGAMSNAAEINWIRTNQINKYTETVNNRKAYVNAYNALKTEAARDKVDEIVSSDEYLSDIREMILDNELLRMDSGIAESHAEAGAESAVSLPQAPSFSKKYALLGLCAGILIYACIYVAYMVLSRRMRRESELQDGAGIKNFGGVYEYPYKGLIGRFLHDKNIYAFRHRKSGASFEESVKKVSDSLSSRVKFENLSEISAFRLGSSDAFGKKVMDETGKAIAEGVKINVVNTAKRVSELKDEEILGLKSAVLYIPSGTSMNEILNLVVRLREYDIPVLGTVFMEGR